MSLFLDVRVLVLCFQRKVPMRGMIGFFLFISWCDRRKSGDVGLNVFIFAVAVYLELNLNKTTKQQQILYK